MDTQKGSARREFVWVIFAQVAGLVGGLIGLKLLTNVMNAADFGVYQLGWSIALVVATAFFNPLGQAVVRLHSVYTNAGAGSLLYRRTLVLGGRVFAGIALIGIVASIVVERFAGWPVWLGLAALVAVAGHGISLVFQQYQTALRQRVSYAASQIFISLGRPLAGVAAILALASTSLEPAYALAGSGYYLLCVSTALSYVVRRAIKAASRPGGGGDVAGVLPSLNSIVAPMALLGSLTILSQYSDRWLMGGTLDLASVGIYTAVYQIATAPLNFAQGAANRFSLPIIFESLGSGTSPQQRAAALRNIRYLIILWVGMIGSAILVSLFAHGLIVRLLTTSEIAGSSALLPLLLTGLALERSAQIQTVRGNMHMQIGRYVPVRIMHVVILVSVGLWLTPNYGVYGFAIAHVAAGAALCIATTWVNYSRFRH